jgi:hypothetical protein
LIFSIYLNIILLPARPKNVSKWKVYSMYLQWIFVPIISIGYGSIPGIDAQTRLMFGKYMGFWVTPKTRKAEQYQHEPITNHS